MTTAVRKLCECGCGKPTHPSRQTRSDRGYVKGEPTRFLHGHHVRGKTGALSSAWKGEKAGYHALHKWVAREKSKVGKCSTCSYQGETDWANISGQYLRELDDYAEMCRWCHRELDAREE